MTRYYWMDCVLLREGWARGTLVGVTEDGCIGSIQTLEPGATSCAPSEYHERLMGFVVPGMANAHSHAFQRGMTGNTEYRSSVRDSFWTWREAMYALANRIEPDDLRTLATQLFIEMLKAGYTSVAEFHYLHRRPDGELYPGGSGLWDAIITAADTAGIGLTLLPTLYQTSDFGAAPLKREQARFALDTQWFLRAIEQRISEGPRHIRGVLRTGAAFHSLRAVPLETLREATLALRAMDSTLPLHIHAAEQVKEVQACVLATGRRPIELLLDTGLLNESWCLVHATHATPTELKDVAASGACVCVSISTEANLGDGYFDTAGFLRQRGRVCVGSDSQATVSPAEELRWMEYQQRLRRKQRAVLADKLEPHVGTRLWRDAAHHGAAAIGRTAGTIAVGCCADWLVLDGTHPSMAGASTHTALDHLLFAGGDAAIRDVMVAGRWVVKDGHHPAEQPLRTLFLEAMSRLSS